MGTSGEGSGDGLQRSDNDSAARTRQPDTVALDAVVKVAPAAVLLEEGVEGAEERHAHKSSRSYCFGTPVTIASSSQASRRSSITRSACSSNVCGIVSPSALLACSTARTIPGKPCTTKISILERTSSAASSGNLSGRAL